MKTIKLILCMLFLAGTTTSCDWWGWGVLGDPVFHEYSLLLSFRDTLGNDLISGIEFDHYNDNITYDELRKSDIFLNDIEFHDYNHRIAYGAIGNEDVFYRSSSINFSGLSERVNIIRFDDDYYLLAGHSYGDVASLPNGRIVIKIRCPHIFGDNELYEFITYWKPEGNKIHNSKNISYECTHIYLKGKEFPIEKNQYVSTLSATIILDR